MKTNLLTWQRTISSQYEFCTHMPVFWASVKNYKDIPLMDWLFLGFLPMRVSAHVNLYYQIRQALNLVISAKSHIISLGRYDVSQA